MSAGITSVCEPSEVQLVPSIEYAAVKVLPARVSFSQHGAPGSQSCTTSFVTPLLVVRAWKIAPFVGVSATHTFGDVASVVWRNIKPAFAHAFVLVSESTRATISP